ncbi:MAG TPA: hypothetical protein VFC56_19170 [Stellaceae bacterium]|nr:hypothetical protein [Stellaceae bacterium]
MMADDPVDGRSRRIRARNLALLLVLLGLVALFYALTIVRMSGS